LGLVTGAVLTAGITAFAAPANADPEPSGEVLEYTVQVEGAVCRTISKYPTIYGVRGILEAIEDEGFTPYEAGEIVALSVTDSCPQFVPVLEKFVAVYGGGGGSTV
jgi:hypothetical protein